MIKGKTTTMADKHSGEGIFFTSKASDDIFFRSHKIKLSFDNQKKDVFVESHKRTSLANNNEADLFISIHTNAGTRNAYGT